MATERELMELASAMRKMAYCPYSRFSVGAALECTDGTVYTGCNIENASYGLTVCAERTALLKAVSEGKRSFRRIVIAGTSDDYCWPCGACRQVLYEFAPCLEVICLNRAGDAVRTTLKELLPHGVDAVWLGAGAEGTEQAETAHYEEI